MKFLVVFVILFLFLSLPSFSQIQVNQTVNPAGGNGGNSDVSLDWSVGQIAVSTLENDQSIIKQGLLQENILVTQTVQHLEDPVEIKVFPNPTSGKLVITISGKNSLVYNLTDSFGKLVLKGQYVDNENTLDIKSLPPGEYFLNISDTNHNVNTYKIIKL